MKRVAIFVLLLCIAASAFARIGGGDSYSGSSSSSSSSSDSSSYESSDSDSGDGGSSGSSGVSGGGDSGAVILLFLLFFIMMVIGQAIGGNSDMRVIRNDVASRPAPATLDALRKYDPNFSEIVFTDFCYSLYARLHEARAGRLHHLAPYVSKEVRDGLTAANVDQIVIGSFTIGEVRGIDTPVVQADVDIEANYTEDAQRWYVRERWTLERKRDILSPAPQNARAEHCPKCGAALQTRTDGACEHCGTLINDGSFQWYLRAIEVLQKESRPPVLAAPYQPERGTDMPSVIQPWIGRRMNEFAQKHPGFAWPAFEARVREVATELQAAWTSLDWERARRYETDALFQMHRYWIDEYKRQALRNIVDGYTLDNVEVVKVTSDAFYDAIVVRLFAHGADYTIDAQGNTVGGSVQHRKSWSEYWTFVRGRAAASANARVCPNCGATRVEGQSVVCEYCGGKITSGDFPWILSRIEQDEAYQG